MEYSWKDVAQGWCVSLQDFVGDGTALLPVFDFYPQLVESSRGISVDQFARVKLAAQGFTAHLFRSKDALTRMSTVMLYDGARVGFIIRKPSGCDALSLADSVRGKGLSSQLLAATRELRASLKFAPLPSMREASKQLFCGGSYSVAGLAAVRSAHRSAIERALGEGKPVPAEVLADYPDFAVRLAA